MNEMPLLDEDTKENYNFVQINKSYMKQYRQLIKKSPMAAEILMFLVEKMGRTTNAIVCSHKTLGEVTNTSSSTVTRALRLLKEEHWIDAVKIGSATAYCVNARVFWQAARNHKKYAMFQAIVIAGADEQESSYPELAKHSLKHIPFIEETDRPIITNEDLPPPDQTEMLLN